MTVIDTTCALDVYGQQSQNLKVDKQSYSPSLLSVIEISEIKTGGAKNLQERTAGTGFFGS